jgi:hypothetical protein
VGRIERFILFYGRRQPNEMGGAQVEAFLPPLPRGADTTLESRGGSRC